MLLSAVVVTLLGILLALLLAFLLPDLHLRQASDHPDPRHLPVPGAPQATFQPYRLRPRSLTTQSHAVVVGTMAPTPAPIMKAKKSHQPTQKKN